MDYAFGPNATPDDPTGVLRQMGYLSAPAAAGTSDPLVANAQASLNRYGYGPLAVDGILGPKTTEALNQWHASRGMTWDGKVTPALVEQLAKEAPTSTARLQPLPATTTPAALQPQAVPFYKNPLFIALAVAGLGAVGYLMWRAEDIKKALAGDVEPEGDEEPVKGKRRRTKTEREKCGLTPDWDSAGQPVRTSLTELPYAVPVKE